MKTAKAQRISPAPIPPAPTPTPATTDLRGAEGPVPAPKRLAERDAAEFTAATYEPHDVGSRGEPAGEGQVTAKAGSPRPPSRPTPMSGRKAKGKKTKAQADKTRKAKGEKASQAATPVTLSEEAMVAVDRRTPQAAIPVLEREAARMNADKKPTKKGGKSPGPKPTKAPERLSCLDAAFQVLSASKDPMKPADMIAAMTKKGLWSSPKGKTPEASLNAAIIREISGKGKESRFVKTGRGLFATTGRPPNKT